MVYSTLETESSMALPTDCRRVTGKPEVIPRASKPALVSNLVGPCFEANSLRGVSDRRQITARGLGPFSHHLSIQILMHNPIQKCAAVHDFGGIRHSPRACKSLKNLRVQDCHGRGRGFEPRRPRHRFQKTYMESAEIKQVQKDTVCPFCALLLVSPRTWKAPSRLDSYLAAKSSSHLQTG
jgi:hypothetical protein